MVKLTEVEDEHFTEKPAATRDGALIAGDDESDGDYTDTGALHTHSNSRLLSTLYDAFESGIPAFQLQDFSILHRFPRTHNDTFCPS